MIKGQTQREDCGFCGETCVITVKRKIEGNLIDARYNIKSNVFHLGFTACCDCLLIRADNLDKETINKLILAAKTNPGFDEE